MLTTCSVPTVVSAMTAPVTGWQDCEVEERERERAQCASGPCAVHGGCETVGAEGEWVDQGDDGDEPVTRGVVVVFW